MPQRDVSWSYKAAIFQKFLSLKTQYWVSPVHGPESRPVSRGQGIAELWKRDSKEKITDKSFSYSVIIDS